MKLLGILLMGLTLLTQLTLAEDQHEHGSSKGVQLRLNAEKKWETDAPLRTGMTGIRDLMESKLSAIHEAKLTEAQFTELSDRITANLNSIFRNCKLNPAADKQLHLILIQIMDGAKIMKSAERLTERRTPFHTTPS